MAGRWLQQACRVYLALVIVTAFLALAAFAAFYLPAAVVRGYELVLEQAENVATLAALLSVFVGVALCVGCLWSKLEPPDVLVCCTLIAVLLCAFTLLFLPAIVVP
jgi:hypothetical protein